nr:peptidase C48, SUMO/sentrin/Ubl1 [Tanacetum cinerariifolium]
ENIIEIGFGSVLDFKIKDVPTRLSYWLLENSNEETCVLNVNDKAIPITREIIKDVLGVPMGSVYMQAYDEADFRHRVIDIFTKVLNHAELYHDPLKPMRKVFFETSMMNDGYIVTPLLTKFKSKQHEWDVKDSSTKEDDVKEAVEKINENMMHILRTTSYRNLSNVGLRIKYAAKILLLEINQKKSDFEVESEEAVAVRRATKFRGGFP